jgi:hypothetical protein
VFVETPNTTSLNMQAEAIRLASARPGEPLDRTAEAGTRRDVELIDLHSLYYGT